MVPHSKFIKMLTGLCTEVDPSDLHRWVNGVVSGPLDLMLLQERCMDDLILFAREEEIGWEVGTGWRCDVREEQACVLVCDNKLRGKSESYEIRAMTAQGALLAGILVILRDREQRAREVALAHAAQDGAA